MSRIGMRVPGTLEAMMKLIIVVAVDRPYATPCAMAGQILQGKLLSNRMHETSGAEGTVNQME